MCIVYHLILFTIPPDIYHHSFLHTFHFPESCYLWGFSWNGPSKPLLAFTSLILAHICLPLGSISNNPLPSICSQLLKDAHPMWLIKVYGDPEIALIGIYPKDTKIQIRRDTCLLIFITILSTIAKLWNVWSKCSLIDKWIKMWLGHLSHLSLCFLILAQIMTSQFGRLSPTSGSMLTAWSLFQILSLPLSLPLPHSCSLSLSLSLSLKINK